jgi:hypothetical protein
MQDAYVESLKVYEEPKISSESNSHYFCFEATNF